MQLAISRHFAFPLRLGYDYITDLGRWPEYWPGLIRVEPGSRWSQPGDTARLTLRLLGVRPEEVVPGQLREAAGRRLVAEGAVGSSVVVVVKPDGERGGALV